MYHDHEFLQVLEGDQQVVQDLFISIKKDLRHFNVILLAEGEKESRTFAKWSMAYLELNANEIQKHGFIKDLKAFLSLLTNQHMPSIYSGQWPFISLMTKAGL